MKCGICGKEIDVPEGMKKGACPYCGVRFKLKSRSEKWWDAWMERRRQARETKRQRRPELTEWDKNEDDENDTDPEARLPAFMLFVLIAAVLVAPVGGGILLIWQGSNWGIAFLIWGLILTFPVMTLLVWARAIIMLLGKIAANNRKEK